jgi:acyl transferase domain-containing protein/NAD(P)-dependent dehydrogenase (short-subunit alcohol dehydrogenase family)
VSEAKGQSSGEHPHPIREPLAIIGIGSMFPKAENLEQYWALIKNGVDAITEIPDTHWNPDDYYSPDQKKPDFTYGKRGGFLSPYSFDPLKYGIPPNVLEATDTSQLLGMVVAEQAMDDAGYGLDKEFNREKVSVVLGVTGALELVVPLGARLGHPQWRRALEEAGLDAATVDDAVERIADSYVDWQENSFPGLLGNVVAGRISKYLNTGGTNCVVDAACASSLSALHLAALELQTGKADMAITGGADTFNDIFMYMCFSKTPALSPTGNAKPFDQSGDGTILGEGLGMVVMKRLSDAERDGDKIYAVIRGIGSSSDGKGDAIYAPSSPGQMKALRAAYEDAQVSPDTIDLLEAHGTGTLKGDAVETAALSDVYGEARRDGSWVALGSVKSQIGHTKSSAGAAGMIKAALGLYHKVLPPTIKVDEPSDAVAPGATPFYVNTIKRPWVPSGDTPRRAAVSAFGFGGSNFHMVLEEYDGKKSEVDWDGEVQIVAFSAPDVAGLQKQISDYPDGSDWHAVRVASAKTRESFDANAPCRLVLVLEHGKSDVSKLLDNASAQLKKQDAATWSTPDGIYFGSDAPEGKVAVVFPGQGAQYTGMLRDVACQFPEMLDALASANEEYETGDSSARLSDLIYPHPTFDKESAKRDQAALTATHVAQPALGAVSLGAYSVLKRFGVQADAFAGHSYGELTALCAGGVYDASSLIRASQKRGELMGQGDGDKGSMVAVRADLGTIEEVIREAKLDVIVANKNTPEQSVLSGATSAIDAAVTAFGERNIPCTKLTVAAAFHSELVSDAAEPFTAMLQDLDFQSATTPVYANTTAQVYPDKPEAMREQLGHQLARPVEFVKEIEAMYADGVRTFVEAGPGGRLSGMIKAILGDREHVTLAVDGSNGKKSGIADLGRVLAGLAVQGREVNLTLWDEHVVIPEESADTKPRLTVTISGANHRSQKAASKPKRPPVAKAPVDQPAAASRTHQPVSSSPSAPAPVAPSMPKTQTASAATPASAPGMAEILRQAQANIAALQQMQQQTAQLHQQFLQGQETASQTFQSLLHQQQQLFSQTGGAIPAAVTMPAVAPPTVQSTAAAAPASVTPSTVPVPEPASTTPESATDGTVSVLLAIVAEKTGYPVEMLELDMALDADLGIDSIKRVEILSAVQEQIPSLPTIEAEELGAIQTLGDIVAKLGDAPGDSGAVPAAGGSAAPGVDVAPVLMQIISEKTGYPVEMLELDMALDADLGIDSIKRVEILSAVQEEIPDLPAVEAEVLGALQTLRDVVDHLQEAVPAMGTAAVFRAASGVDTGEVESVLLQTVSEKTGYPVEMLDLDMALDADLGIDSIKRVEILSAMQEALPDLPAVEAEVLGALQTLRDVIEHVGSSVPSTGTGSSGSSAVSGIDPSEVQSLLLATVSEKTGYPVEMLDLGMAMDADLGIDSIKRVEILSALQEAMPALPTVEAEQLGQLQTLQDVIDILQSAGAGDAGSVPSSSDAAPDWDDDKTPLVRQVLSLKSVESPEGSRIALPEGGTVAVWSGDDALARGIADGLLASGLNGEVVSDVASLETLCGLILVAPKDGCADAFLKQAFGAMQAAAPKLKQAGDAGGAILASVTRMDGGFGLRSLDSEGAVRSGGLAGLVKTASHEWEKVACRVVDVDPAMDIAKAAGDVTTLVTMDAPLETGITADGFAALELSEEPLPDVTGETLFTNDDVVVVTGGARGVTAEVAAALADAGEPTLVLMGRSPLPAEEEAWLAELNDEAAIKRALMDHAAEKLSPKELGKRCAAVLANREIRQNLARLEASGSKVDYRSVDIRDTEAVGSAIDEIRAKFGFITGLIHGAGVLADKLIEEKTVEQFDFVYDTKAGGLAVLLDAMRDDPLKGVVLFSSSTGRFGRKGQVDYAVANEVLNKTAQALARNRSDCKVVSVNWGPWAGGMVTPALRKVFADEGVGVIGLRAGAEYLVQELAQPTDGPVEIVILGATEGSGDADASERELTPALLIDLNAETHSFLKSHVIDGKAVLPVAMYLEWFAQAALHANPGLHFLGMDDLRVFKGLILETDETRSLTIVTGKAAKRGAEHVVRVELRSGTSPVVVHARGDAVLGTKYAQETSALNDIAPGPYPKMMDEVYNNGLLFHGEAFQGITAVEGCSENEITVTTHTAPAPTTWMKNPPRKKWLSDPLAVDSAFQALILWSFERHQAGSLPVFIRSYRQYQSAYPKGDVKIAARVEKDQAHQAVSTVELVRPEDGKLLARLEGYECVIDPSLNAAFRRSHLAQQA